MPLLKQYSFERRSYGNTGDRIFSSVAGICIIVMLLSVFSVFDYLRLSFTDRGSVEEIEAREDALIGTALLAGGLVIAALVHFIGMETIAPTLWRIFELGALFGTCAVATQIIRLAVLVLTARGQSERIAEAKSNLFHAAMGALAGTLIFFVVKHFN